MEESRVTEGEKIGKTHTPQPSKQLFSKGAFHFTTRTNQGKMEREGNQNCHRIDCSEKPVIYLSLQTDGTSQKKNKLRCTAVPEPCVQLSIRRKFRSCV